jgi:hypothetical protein
MFALIADATALQVTGAKRQNIDKELSIFSELLVPAGM